MAGVGFATAIYETRGSANDTINKNAPSNQGAGKRFRSQRLTS